MTKSVRLYERDMKLFIPWNAPRPEFSCKPYSLEIALEPKPLHHVDSGEEKHFFSIAARCPLGTQTFAVLYLPADSDLYDFDLPVDFDVMGWVEHAMCGSCLCKYAQIFMDARRSNKPEKFKQDWMFLAATENNSGEIKLANDGDENLRDRIEDSREITNLPDDDEDDCNFDGCRVIIP